MMNQSIKYWVVYGKESARLLAVGSSARPEQALYKGEVQQQRVPDCFIAAGLAKAFEYLVSECEAAEISNPPHLLCRGRLEGPEEHQAVETVLAHAHGTAVAALQCISPATLWGRGVCSSRWTSFLKIILAGIVG
jgi:hypothetical protein